MLLAGDGTDSFGRMLAVLRPVFTAPTFETFCAMAVGMVCQIGARTVCGVLVGAGLSRVWRDERAHRFFSRAVWELDELGLRVAELVVARLIDPDGAVSAAGSRAGRDARPSPAGPRDPARCRRRVRDQGVRETARHGELRQSPSPQCCPVQAHAAAYGRTWPAAHERRPPTEPGSDRTRPQAPLAQRDRRQVRSAAHRQGAKG